MDILSAWKRVINVGLKLCSNNKSTQKQLNEVCEHFEDYWIQPKCSIMADKHEKCEDKEMLFGGQTKACVLMRESSIATMVWQMLIIHCCLIEVNYEIHNCRDTAEARRQWLPKTTA